MPIPQHHLRTWRDTYYQQAQAALLAHPAPIGREKLFTQGQSICIASFLQALAFLDTGDLTPQQLEGALEHVLAWLADTQSSHLIESVHFLQRRKAAQETIWWVEGILCQADQTREDLLTVLPPEWQPDRRVWGHTYQIYHARDACPLSIDEAVLRWHDPDQRGQAFEEIGVVHLDRVGEVMACLDAVLACSNSRQDAWIWKNEVCGLRPGEPPRSTSLGDVIIPGLGEAWMVEQSGFRLLAPAPLQAEQRIIHDEDRTPPGTHRLSRLLARWHKGWEHLFPGQMLLVL